jgi:hypothetical protein
MSSYPIRLIASPADHRNRLLFAILVSGFSSVFISYCTAWCLRVTSSTTYRFIIFKGSTKWHSMAGALNKLPVAVSGMIFFDAPVTFFSVTAVMIGIAFRSVLLTCQDSVQVLSTLLRKLFNLDRQ